MSGNAATEITNKLDAVDVITRASRQLQAMMVMLQAYFDNQNASNHEIAPGFLSNYVWQMQENIENIDAATKHL
ncbi:hypothetical protein [Marinobacter sp. NFXS9]|uniref:hypothetical protein n=1 Tax=Marinobacter sp. NFXS9 TaxID=2818433 RepID=UPI0032DF92CC